MLPTAFPERPKGFPISLNYIGQLGIIQGLHVCSPQALHNACDEVISIPIIFIIYVRGPLRLAQGHGLAPHKVSSQSLFHLFPYSSPHSCAFLITRPFSPSVWVCFNRGIISLHVSSKDWVSIRKSSRYLSGSSADFPGLVFVCLKSWRGKGHVPSPVPTLHLLPARGAAGGKCVFWCGRPGACHLGLATMGGFRLVD